MRGSFGSVGAVDMTNVLHSGYVSRSVSISHQSGMIDAITDWCDALRGGMPLAEAFAGLIAGLRAEAGMLVRTSLSDFRPARIAVWDRNGAHCAHALSKSFADGFFGSSIARPRAASLWLASEFSSHGSELSDPALETWQEHRGYSEFMVLVLASSSNTRDHVELHFRDRLTPTEIESFETILPMMARTWAARQVGLVTRCVVNHRRPEPRPREAAPILSITNPARLSRAEFRVCLLLSRGLSAASIAGELSVSEATIRTHLRNIYSKTETTGLPDLVYQLVKGRDWGDHGDIRCA